MVNLLLLLAEIIDGGSFQSTFSFSGIGIKQPAQVLLKSNMSAIESFA
jgi:hypothetical protein